MVGRPAARRLAGKRGLLALTTTALAASLVAPGAAQAASRGPHGPQGKNLHATIRYTEHGIPHIKASNYANLGFGVGYAAAKHNICTIAETYITVNGQRSRYFGPTARVSGSSSSTNLASDVFYQSIIDRHTVRRLIGQEPPHGPRREVREIIRGYAAGYNKYLRETGVEHLTDPACRGQAWVTPIEPIDVYRQFYASMIAGGTARAVDGITGARPPDAGQSAATAHANKRTTPGPGAVARVREVLNSGGMGSNAIAIGSAGTENGHGLLLGNPHYPWHGARRFWQMQLTVPGRMNVSGVGLLGTPLVLIGHTAHVAWSHTVATPVTFTLYELDLAEGSPTTYVVDGKKKRMTERRVTVTVRRDNGSLDEVTRTVWSTRYGPVLTSLGGMKLPWTHGRAYAIADANATNMRGLNTWFAMDQAQSTADIRDALRTYQGIPWVNTIAADDQGNALYADVQVVPHVTDAKAERCNTALGKKIFPATGLAVLDGSRSECRWGSDPDAVQPGIFGPDSLPVLAREDYVANSNNSYWLSNPEQPLTGFPRIMGAERTRRSLRTRMGITAIKQRLKGTDDLPGRGFSLDTMRGVALGNRSYAAELARTDTVAMCESFPGGMAPTSQSSDGRVDVSAACQVLAGWDGRYDPDSRGALLFDRFWRRAVDAGDELWKVPFDPDHPVTTPNTLNTGNPGVRRAFGDAVAELRAAGIPLDAPLGKRQYVVRNGDRIPIHGGTEALGVLNKIEGVWNPPRGYTEVVTGSSYIQVVSFDGTRCPNTRTILTYSQSGNPNSPYYSDQTRLYSKKRWVTERFCEREIRHSPKLRVVKIREKAKSTKDSGKR